MDALEAWNVVSDEGAAPADRRKAAQSLQVWADQRGGMIAARVDWPLVERIAR